MSGGVAADGAALIGLDWGTSNLRVLRIAPGGRLISTRSDPRGAGRLSAGDFPAVLSEVAGGWLDDGLPILACGMAGGRGKWREVAYLTTPASIDDLAAGLAAPEGPADVLIVPGVQRLEQGRMTDVMRGEETQVMGLDLEEGLNRIVAPGTHSKWITSEPGCILSHRTFMTGELFSAIRQGTIMGAGMGEPGVNAQAFALGVDRALQDRHLTAALFSVRVESLADRLKAEETADYLSGLLIGAEVDAQAGDRNLPVTLVGAESLTARYQTALALAGFSDVRLADGATATARGLWRVYEARNRS